MYQLFLIFLGGGVGSLVRYAFNKHLNRIGIEGLLPLGTLSANLLSCFIVGCVAQTLVLFPLPSSVVSDVRNFVVIGFCGGFSTFSTFANENFIFIQQQQSLQAFAYTFLSFSLGVFAIWLGAKLISYFFAS
jgi:CrcB protein